MRNPQPNISCNPIIQKIDSMTNGPTPERIQTSTTLFGELASNHALQLRIQYQPNGNIGGKRAFRTAGNMNHAEASAIVWFTALPARHSVVETRSDSPATKKATEAVPA